MRNITFRITRSTDGKAYVQEYRFPFQKQKTIVWWLTRIQEELDASLTFPVSCRAGLCGGCGLRINGRPVLACETMPDDYLSETDDSVTIQPLQNFPVVRDLAIDWSTATERMNRMVPRDPPGRGADLPAEGRLKPDVCDMLMKLGTCITCGLCVSECPAMASGKFIEPYIFVKCRSILVDTRVEESYRQSLRERLRTSAVHCLRCGKCAGVCPSSLSPEDSIASL